MEDKLRRVKEEPDFVNLKKYGHSLAAVRKAHPGGCSPAIRARALMMTEDEASRAYAGAVAKLRRNMMAPAEREDIERRLLMELTQQVESFVGSIEVQGRALSAAEKRIVDVGNAFLRALRGEPDGDYQVNDHDVRAMALALGDHGYGTKTNSDASHVVIGFFKHRVELGQAS